MASRVFCNLQQLELLSAPWPTASLYSMETDHFPIVGGEIGKEHTYNPDIHICDTVTAV